MDCHNQKSFTLIELLIVMGILAILAVVVILVINPAEFLKQARDSTRMSELQELNKAIGVYQADGKTSFGSSNTIYVSIPDSTSTCVNLGLPTPPSGWSFHCVGSSTLRNVDSYGWIPVNLTSISFGSPLNTLPIDPVNTTSSGQYYTYVTGGSWEFTSEFESDKYSYISTNDNDSFPGVYSVRTSISPLTPGLRDKGLVGYWKFDETSGTLYDSSGYNNNGTQSGEVTYGATGKVGNALSFDGSDDYVATSINNLPLTDLTIGFWAKKTSIEAGNRPFGYENSGSGTHGLAVYFSTTTNPTLIMRNNGVSYDMSFGTITLEAWYYYVVAISSSAGTKVYLNGVNTNSNANAKNYTSAGVSFKIGQAGAGTGSNFGGSIDEVRVYNRALSAAEISAIYNATK